MAAGGCTLTSRFFSLGPSTKKQGGALFWRLSLSAVILRIRSVGNLNHLRSSVVQKHMWPDRILVGTGKHEGTNAEIGHLIAGGWLTNGTLEQS